jgi:hypothetical protein
MSPVRVWFGLVFLAMGVLAIFDATGTVSWSSAFDGWWPVAIVGWGLADVMAHRRFELGGVVIAVIGAALLAEQQAWAGEAVVWSALFLLVGAAILVLDRHRDPRLAGEDRPAEAATPATQG